MAKDAVGLPPEVAERVAKARSMSKKERARSEKAPETAPEAPEEVLQTSQTVPEAPESVTLTLDVPPKAQEEVEKAPEEAPKATETVEKAPETPEETPEDASKADKGAIREGMKAILCVKKGKRDVPTEISYYSEYCRADRYVIVDINRNLLAEAWAYYCANRDDKDPEVFLATVYDICKVDIPRMYRAVGRLRLE